MTDADRPAFLQTIARLAVALREPQPDGLLIRTNFEALQDLEIELVVAAADRLIASSSWFPKASEWRREAVQVERERVEHQRAQLRKLPAPLCAACEDTQWARSGDGVTRCSCAVQRRLELLGRQPSPVGDVLLAGDDRPLGDGVSG